MSLKKIVSHRGLLIVVGAATIFIVPFLIISGMVISRTYKRIRLNNICVDYYTEQYAWVVDENGKGIDSVSVALKDNANFNLIYRTFTDSTGKFVLFNDFGSFALYNMPFSYELQVSFKGYKDTVVYRFQRYRVCHFRKTEGPDTIVMDLSEKAKNRIIAEYGKKVSVDEVFEYAPFEKISLSSTVPSGLKNPLHQYRAVKYGLLVIGKKRVLFAVTDKFRFDENTGYQKGNVWFVIDRNFNNELDDDPYKQWNLVSGNEEGDVADCDIRQCYIRDTLHTDKEKVILDLQLEGFSHPNTFLYYRRGDALKAVIELQGKRVGVVLWDRLMTNFTDLKNVQIGIDRNGDRRFSSKAGDAEILETAFSGIGLDNMYYEIDSIAPDGSSIFYLKTTKDTVVESGASVGDWANDFKDQYTQSMSLYNEISNHELVVLCFFEGNSQQCMETMGLGAVVGILGKYIKNIRVIGINRKTFGPHYTGFPVIEENMGWKGALVRQFHNHLEKEVICIDSTGTIISRGAPDKALIESVWTRLGKKGLSTALSDLDRAIDEMAVIGTVGE